MYLFLLLLLVLLVSYPENHCQDQGQETFSWGFPGGAVVENLPANAGDTGSSPGLGGSRMPQSDWAREPQITEPAHLEPVLCNGRGRDSERPAQRDEEWSPLATTRESPHTEMKTQHSNQPINKNVNF